MKIFLKLIFLSAAFIFSSAIFGQEPVKKDAKQTPKETKDQKKDSSTTEKKGGGTRMAINEQGVPNKSSKNKSKSTSTNTTDQKTTSTTTETKK